MEYSDNLRSVHELQELFLFCRDKIEIAERFVEMETDLCAKKRQNDILNLEMSSLKNKL
jgi:hypothetical protein